MIVDFHTHIFPDWINDNRDLCVERDPTFGELFSNPRSKIVGAEELVGCMDEDGIDVSVIMGIGWNDLGLAIESNDYLIETVSRYEGRLVAFAGVNPAWGDASAREANRCAQAGLKGIGELHPDTQGFDLGDMRVLGPFLEAVRHDDLIVTTHSSEPLGHAYGGKGRTHPELLWNFIQRCPDVTIVCAHWGGGLPFYSLMPEVEEGLSNVYFDTAASPFLYKPQVFESVVSIVGADRVLMASDYPLIRGQRLLRQIEDSSMSENEKNAVMGGNAVALLRL